MKIIYSAPAYKWTNERYARLTATDISVSLVKGVIIGLLLSVWIIGCSI